MPRHESIEATLIDIFSRHKDFFDKMASDTQMDGYKNAFISLADKGHNIKHYEECFESLRQASQEATIAIHNFKSEPIQDKSVVVDDKVIGGEGEFRDELNRRLSPKTVARATLYNYLETLKIRKDTYTQKDLTEVLNHILTLKKTRKK
jgi:hypothetical protein